MKQSSSFCVYMLFIMSCCCSGYPAGNFLCKTPPFDRRRCYQLHGNKTMSYNNSSEDCKATGQRLASIENEELVMFIVDNIEFTNIWIGLSRTSDGQPDVWTNGHRLDAELYPSVSLNVSRGDQDKGKLCSTIYKNNSIAIVNDSCGKPNHRLCETVRSSIFQVRALGDVLKDVSKGQLVASDIVISVIHCVRNCRQDWTCDAISHDGVTCQLHFQQAGHSITVTSSAAVFKRMK